MENYLITIDSSQRDTSLYPNSQNYIIQFNKPLYNIESIKLITARIPLSQYTIDHHNNVFVIDNVEHYLTNGDYTTGGDLAAQIQHDIHGSAIHNVVYDNSTQKLTLSGPHDFVCNFSNKNTPALVMGFDHTEYTSVSNELVAPGIINIDITPNIILSLTGNSDDYIRSELYNVIKSEPNGFYGVIVNNEDNNNKIINYSSTDKITREFHDGALPFMDQLNIRFFINNFSETFPYDFKLKNHTIKLEIRASMDKRIVTKENDDVEKMTELPPKLELDRFKDQYRPLGDKRVIVYGGAVLVFLIFVMLLSSFNRGVLRQTRAGPG